MKVLVDFMDRSFKSKLRLLFRSMFFFAGIIMASTDLYIAEKESSPQASLGAEILDYNYILGTQTFAPQYQFTDEDELIETSKAILEMGSNILKIYIGHDYDKLYGFEIQPGILSYRDLVEKHDSYRKVLDMPFRYYFFWCHTAPVIGGIWDNSFHWYEGFSDAEKEEDYKQIYDLVCYLLREYSGTGKSFYIGHWEGDWSIMEPPYKVDKEVSDEAISGMIQRLNNRQRAVDNAKKDTPHNNVEVYHYTEVVLVAKGMEGKRTMVNAVLPYTNVDFVSFSSYSSLGPYWRKNLSVEKRKKIMREMLTEALDYIEEKLPETSKKLPWDKRVFIGEYGFRVTSLQSVELQDEFTRNVAGIALEWGCPFVLYWQIYDNTPQDGEGVAHGFSMIDTKGIKKPVYKTHSIFYERSQEFIKQFRNEHGRYPDECEFRNKALEWLSD